MSRQDYLISRNISKDDPDFYALIMAAMRKADDYNLAKLKREWPDVWAELEERYKTSGGYTLEELEKQANGKE